MLSVIALVLVLPTIYGLYSKDTKKFDLEKTEARILNGNEADDHQFPFHAEIVVEQGITFCTYGGSIIAERYILTAAAIFVSPG